MAKLPEVKTPTATTPAVPAQAPEPVKPPEPAKAKAVEFVPSGMVNAMQLRQSVEWRVKAGLTAMQALDTALGQMLKDEYDAWERKQKSPAKA
jgi:hypothetical protein